MDVDARIEKVRMAARLGVMEMAEEMEHFTLLLPHLELDTLELLADTLRKALVAVRVELTEREGTNGRT